MIKSFACKETEKIFHEEQSLVLPENIQRSAFRKLWMIHRADRLIYLMHLPGNRLESLKGDRKGQWSIRINRQWRICFQWRDTHAYNVEIVDYH